MKSIIIRETSGKMLTAFRHGVKLFSMHKRLHKAFYARVRELEGIIRRAGQRAQARVNEFLAMLRLVYICRALSRLVAPEPMIVAEPEIIEVLTPEQEALEDIVGRVSHISDIIQIALSAERTCHVNR
jgi:hypothetical protein